MRRRPRRPPRPPRPRLRPPRRPTVPVPVAPLTGLPGRPRRHARPAALVVKIDNGDRQGPPAGRPQRGRRRVRGAGRGQRHALRWPSSTRRTRRRSARSGRPGRPTSRSSARCTTRTTRGAGPTPPSPSRVRAAAMKDVGYDALSGEYFREPSRPRPENLMLKSTADDHGACPNEGSAPPPPLFTYRAEPASTPRHLGAAQRACTSATAGPAERPGRLPVERHAAGRGSRTARRTSTHGGQQVAPENVVIQFVNYVPTDVGDQFGVPIPEAQLVGEGEAWVLTAGGIVTGGEGRWIKHAPTAPSPRYTQRSTGNPISSPPAARWVALPAPGRRPPLLVADAASGVHRARRYDRAHGRRRSPPHQPRHRHHAGEAGAGGDAQGRRDHGRGRPRAGEDRRGRRRRRGDGARAGAVRHPARRRRRPHVRPRDDRGHQGGGHRPGDGQGPHRPLRRGAGARGARRRLRRRVRGAHARRRGAPHRQVGVHRARSCAAPPTSARRSVASAKAPP